MWTAFTCQDSRIFLSGSGGSVFKADEAFAENWNDVMNRRPKQGYVTPGDGAVSVEEKNLAEYNMQFMEDMRRFLKGDEGMLSAFELRNRRNPMEYAVINYMAKSPTALR